MSPKRPPEEADRRFRPRRKHGIDTAKKQFRESRQGVDLGDASEVMRVYANTVELAFKASRQRGVDLAARVCRMGDALSAWFVSTV